MSYFIALANQRKMKKCIASLEEDGVTYSDNNSMLTHAMSYYKRLFGKKERNNVNLRDDFWEEDEKVSMEENQILESEFTEEEIFNAIKGSYAEGVTCPDVFFFSILPQILVRH
jgi:hypothetical protein